MIGLSTTIFKSAGKKLVNLFGSLASRSTYVENVPDSLSEKNHIDDLGVLDKATILLTPTATSNARVHSVKTYTGDELVTNGTFNTDLTDWQISSWWTWNALGAYHPTTNSHKPLYQQTCEVGKTYRISFDLNVLQGGAKVSLGTNTGSTSQVFATNLSTGSYVYYIKAEYEYIIFNRNNASGNNEYYLDNVSIVDVSSDFDFDRASSATRINSSGLVQDMQSITDPELVLNGDFEELGDEEVTNGSFDTDSNWTLTQATISNGVASFATTDGSFAGIRQNVFTTGKTYLISLDVSDLVGTAEVNTNGGTSIGLEITTNGTKSFYMKAENTDIEIKRKFGITNVSATIDNVSVQQVDPNDRWSLGTGWSIEDGKLVGDGTNTSFSSAQQSNLTVSGNTYQITLTVEAASGAIELKGSGVYTRVDSLGVGTHTLTFVADATYFRFLAHAGATATIDNISLKDITFSTDVDLARINYDSNGDNGHILLEPTSTNLQDYSENFDEWTHNNGDFTITNELAPDGKTKVYKSTTGATTGSAHFFTGPPVLVGTHRYTASYFFKYVDHPWVRITHISSTTTGVWFNIQNGTIGTENGTSVGKIEDYGNGWYRCSNTFTATQTADSTNVFGAISHSDNNTDAPTNKNVLVWGAQVENLEYPTSYIPVHSTSNVTRATETLTGSGNSTLINSTEGVLYAEIAKTVTNPDTFRLISLNNAASNSDASSVTIGFEVTSDDFYIRIKSGGVVVLQSSSQAATANDYHKVAVKFKSGSSAIFINGTKLTSYDVGDGTGTFTFPVSLDNLSFDYNGNGTLPFYGKCKALAVFNEALEDDELELLTGVTNYGSFGALAAADGYTII